MTKKPLIAGNWKMNLNHFEAIAHVQKIAYTLPVKYYSSVDVTVLVPFTDLRSVQTLVDGDKLLLTYGAQDVSPHDKGAYTGDISAAFLAKLGCSYVVIGHSERRSIHAETDLIVRDKIKAALRYQITPIVCVGEELSIREKGTHIEHCLEQLEGSFADLTAQQIAECVIAYEPIWAIGTGKVASAADAQQMCENIRQWAHQRTDKDTALGLRILYGGSVTSDNIGELIAQQDIDGALVGGASLKWEDFTKICAIAAGPQVNAPKV